MLPCIWRMDSYSCSSIQRHELVQHVADVLDAVLSSAEVIMATRAPAIMDFSTSSAVCTPPVTARSALIWP